MMFLDSPETVRLNDETVGDAVGKCVEFRPTLRVGTVVKVVNKGVLVKFDDGGTGWHTASMLNRRADLDNRVIETRRRRR